ncbi:type II restriction endonuclease [Oceanicella actignis]|uniref:type II restriction endonuclease n=1 Tax=Oceanicella actignis TaxID=1189325 RepID=UPI0011E83230|nr:type II restriction endonuclease [Oceanicella actignis]TYO91465.1 EcoRII-like protein [Oceanicella actignis]
MQRERLSRLFTGVVVKRLAAVEAEPASSNQHEFNGTLALRRLLGTERRERMPAKFIWLGGENEGLSSDGFLTWYDARERHPTRSEWRLYFPSNEVMELASEGDLLLIAKRPDGELLVVVVPAGSQLERGILWLFDVGKEIGSGFLFQDVGHSDRELDFAARFILDELGIDAGSPEEGRLDELAENLLRASGGRFPSTSVVSGLARAEAEAPDPWDDPDGALMAWLDFEEALFRRLERAYFVMHLPEHWSAGGDPDVDGVLKMALSFLNRRKSRMGLSLEHHVEEVIRAWRLRYDRGASTEGKSSPDFLFPGAREYHDPAFDARLLTMLGVKSTLKDRWRQVLAEAERIPEKHLLTLQAGVSVHQMDEMRRNSLRLVVPQSLHEAYDRTAVGWLMRFRDFLGLVRDRQARADAPG